MLIEFNTSINNVSPRHGNNKQLLTKTIEVVRKLSPTIISEYMNDIEVDVDDRLQINQYMIDNMGCETSARFLYHYLLRKVKSKLTCQEFNKIICDSNEN